ncbi:hypothetical protein NQ317_008246 [Molorchus minor]|uniref:ZAD domain-containing protein n=1 Tax=Molorchus minor TaxID=1323400 RepID=A0ABQ9J130_9CUCU|nr:hypothetical protein NQ317_008246 [Molorchus minor]
MDKSRCRLCLNSIQENRFVMLEEFQTNMLKILVPEVDLGMSTEPKLCDECAKLLVRILEKKERCRSPMRRGSVSSKKSCCLCGEHILEELGSKDLKELKKMADKCVPELNIYASDDATACKKCRQPNQRKHFFYASGNGEKARQEKLKLNVADHKKELTSRMTTRSQDVVNQKDKNTSNSQKQVGKKI